MPGFTVIADSSALILTYHHVADAPTDSGVLSVSPSHFAEHLDVLQREARPVRLDEITRNLGTSGIPPRSVGITFDDGYADNLLTAKPLLERYDIPATVFISAGAPDAEPEFWWDELERLLLSPGRLPQRLELPVAGSLRSCDLGESANYTEDSFRRFRDWKVWEDPPTSRHSLYRDLCPKLKSLSHAGCRAVMSALRASANTHSACPTHRRLTASEILSLHQRDLVEIGSHTLTHCTLPALCSEEQRKEIQGGKSYLEELLNAPVRGFAYPYGDCSGETLEILRETGIHYACSIIIGSVQSDCDRFQLPRHNVFDLDGDQFSEWLRRMWNFKGISENGRH